MSTFLVTFPSPQLVMTFVFLALRKKGSQVSFKLVQDYARTTSKYQCKSSYEYPAGRAVAPRLEILNTKPRAGMARAAGTCFAFLPSTARLRSYRIQKWLRSSSLQHACRRPKPLRVRNKAFPFALCARMQVLAPSIILKPIADNASAHLQKLMFCFENSLHVCPHCRRAKNRDLHFCINP